MMTSALRFNVGNVIAASIASSEIEHFHVGNSPSTDNGFAMPSG